MDLGYVGRARFPSYQQREKSSQGVAQAGNLLCSFVTWPLPGPNDPLRPRH